MDGEEKLCIVFISTLQEPFKTVSKLCKLGISSFLHPTLLLQGGAHEELACCVCSALLRLWALWSLCHLSFFVLVSLSQVRILLLLSSPLSLFLIFRLWHHRNYLSFLTKLIWCWQGAHSLTLQKTSFELQIVCYSHCFIKMQVTGSIIQTHFLEGK